MMLCVLSVSAAFAGSPQELLDHLNTAAAELRAKDLPRITYEWKSGARAPSWASPSLVDVDDITFALNWGDSPAGTLIANRVVAGAYHFKMDRSQRFMDRNARGRTAFVKEYSQQLKTSDVQLALLDRSVHTTVPPHPIIGALPDYKTLTTLVTDKEGKAFWAVGEIRNGFYHYDRNQMEERLVGGDSGNPTYVVYKQNGKFKLALLGVHWFNSRESCMCISSLRDSIVNQCMAWKTDVPVFIDELEDIGDPKQPPTEPDKQRIEIIREYLQGQLDALGR